MTDFLSKLENFLFDVLGLIVPGIILILVIITPLILFNYNEIPENNLEQSKLLSTFSVLAIRLDSIQMLDQSVMLFLVILLSYILGHSIKVLSIIFYEFGTLIFDNTIIKIISFFKDLAYKGFIFLLKKLNQNPKQNLVYKYFKELYSPLNNTFKKIFTFKSDRYYSENKSLVQESVRIINSKLNTVFPEKWYSLYKFANIINSQEKLKSLSSFFLAKYNLYRSLSFIFFIAFFYFVVFYSVTDSLLTSEILKMKSLFLISCGLLWFTFHVKYKRYWTLCGNETLISLYYFLNRDSLRSTNKKEDT